MKGLLFKDITILVKGMKPIYYLIFLIALVVVFAMGGEWGSFYATALLSMFGCMFFTTTVLYDEKARWNKYEVTLPTGRKKSIASKYLIALFSAILCAFIAALLFLINLVIVGNLSWIAFLLQIGIAVLFPLLWSSILLPLFYWIGYQASAFASVIVVLLAFYSMKYFKGPSEAYPTSDTLTQFVWIGVVCTIVLMSISYLICTAIYTRKEYK